MFQKLYYNMSNIRPVGVQFERDFLEREQRQEKDVATFRDKVFERINV